MKTRMAQKIVTRRNRKDCAVQKKPLTLDHFFKPTTKVEGGEGTRDESDAVSEHSHASGYVSLSSNGEKRANDDTKEENSHVHVNRKKVVRIDTEMREPLKALKALKALNGGPRAEEKRATSRKNQAQMLIELENVPQMTTRSRRRGAVNGLVSSNGRQRDDNTSGKSDSRSAHEKIVNTAAVEAYENAAVTLDVISESDGLSEANAELEECLKDDLLTFRPKRTHNAPPRRSARLVPRLDRTENRDDDFSLFSDLLGASARPGTAGVRKRSRLKFSDLIKEREIKKKFRLEIEAAKERADRINREEGVDQARDEDGEMADVIEQAELLMSQDTDPGRTEDATAMIERVLYFSKGQRRPQWADIVDQFLDQSSNDSGNKVVNRFREVAVRSLSEDGFDMWIPSPSLMCLMCHRTPCPKSVASLLFSICAYGDCSSSSGAANRAFRCLYALLAGIDPLCTLSDFRGESRESTSFSGEKLRSSGCEKFVGWEGFLEVLKNYGGTLANHAQALDRLEDDSGDEAIPECVTDMSNNLPLVLRLMAVVQQRFPERTEDDALTTTTIMSCCRILMCPVGQKLSGCLPVPIVLQFIEQTPEVQWKERKLALASVLVDLTHLRDQQKELISSLYSMHTPRLRELRSTMSFLLLYRWRLGPPDCPKETSGLPQIPSNPKKFMQLVMQTVMEIPTLSDRTDFSWLLSVVFFIKHCGVEHTVGMTNGDFINKLQVIKSTMARFTSLDAFQAKMMFATLITVLGVLSESSKTENVQANLDVFVTGAHGHE